jgi:uncharacterized membrane protein SpoIIM required for sporulation
MEFNVFTALIGVVGMWIILALFSSGPKSRSAFIRGDYESRSIGVFWFFVLIGIGALVGGFIPGMM